MLINFLRLGTLISTVQFGVAMNDDYLNGLAIKLERLANTSLFSSENHSITDDEQCRIKNFFSVGLHNEVVVM